MKLVWFLLGVGVVLTLNGCPPLFPFTPFPPHSQASEPGITITKEEAKDINDLLERAADLLDSCRQELVRSRI